MRRLSRRELRNIFLGASLNESTARQAGEVTSVLGAINAMAEANRERHKRALEEQKAQQSQQASLLPRSMATHGLAARGGSPSDATSYVGGFLSNLLGSKGLLGAFTGLPQGVYETGKAAVHDISHGTLSFGHPGGNPESEVQTNIVDPITRSYSHYYGPLLPGGKESFNFGKFWNRVYDAPFQPLLDLATIPSLGASAAVKGAGVARSLGARGPISDALIGLGSVEGRAPLRLPGINREGPVAPVIERRFNPSMNRRLFQRFIGDPLSRKLGDVYNPWREFTTERELNKIANAQSSMRSLTEQKAIEGAVSDIMPALQQGSVADRLLDRIPGVKGRSAGLSEDEQIAFSFRKRGVTPQPLRTGSRARETLALKEIDPPAYRRALAEGASVDWQGYINLRAREARGTITKTQQEHLAEAETEMASAEKRLIENANAPDTLLGRAQAIMRAGLHGENSEGANFEDFAGVPREYVESLINLKPEIVNLIENPTPAMLEASRAWDAAVESQRGELGISPEEHRSRVWATQSLLRGGRPAAELEREFQEWAAAQGGEQIAPNYVPDIPAENLEMRRGKLRDVQNVRTVDPSARAAVERSFVPPRFAYLEDTDLNVFQAGVFRTDTGVLLTHLSKVAKDLNDRLWNFNEISKVAARGPDGDLLKISSHDLDKVMGQSSMKRDWVWVPQDEPVKWFNQEINVLQRAVELAEENRAHLGMDADSVLAQMNALLDTNSRMFVQELMGATKTDGFVVPRQWYERKNKWKELEDWRPGGIVHKYLHFLNKWRSLTLAYMPRWWVNTAVGSFVLNAVKGVWDPRAYIAARRLISEGKGPPGIVLSGGVIRAELHTTGKELFPTRSIFKMVQSIEDHFRAASALKSLDKLEKQSLREIEGVMVDFSHATTGLMDREYVDYLLSDPKRVEVAMDEVNRFSYNFMVMGPFERKYIRNMVPFWGWYKFITKFVWSLPFDYPGRTLVIQKLGQIGAESEEDLGPFVPLWMKGAIMWNKQDPEHLKYMSTFGINPFSSFANPFAQEGFAQGIFRAAQLAPPLQAFASAAGWDALGGGDVPIAPTQGVGRDFFGNLWRGTDQLPNEGGAGGFERFVGSLIRSFPQARTVELFNTGGRPVYPESIPQPPNQLPFLGTEIPGGRAIQSLFPGHEKPMDVRPETIRTPNQLLGQQFGLNIRSKNMVAANELAANASADAAAQSKRDLEEYKKFLKSLGYIP